MTEEEDFMERHLEDVSRELKRQELLHCLEVFSRKTARSLHCSPTRGVLHIGSDGVTVTFEDVPIGQRLEGRELRERER